MTAGGGLVVREFRIAASSDDAEERASGSVRRTSSDRELVLDREGDPTVRFHFGGQYTSFDSVAA